jgi:hypothetical protein
MMIVAAMLPLTLATFWMQRGKVGYTLTLFSVLGACLAIAAFGSTRPIGVNPVHAISAAMLVFLPATLGCAAGALLGWLIYRRRLG